MAFLTPLPADVSSDAQRSLVEQLYYLDGAIQRVSVEGGQVSIESEGELSQASREAIAALIERVVASYSRVEATRLHASGGRGLQPEGDPQPELRRSRQVIEVGPGAYAYQGGFRETLEAIDARVLELARAASAVEQTVPAVADLESMLRHGYLASFPQHVYTAWSVREGPGGVQAFAEAAAAHDPAAVAEAAREHASLRTVLAPAVCYNTFRSLEGTDVAPAGALYTARSRCHRYESRNAEGLRRLQAFSMREIVFLGSREQVEARRRELMRATQVLVEGWGLAYRIETASDPFFAGEADKQRAFQSAFELKYELQAYLPYDESWLAVASFNIHMDKLTQAYAIRAAETGAKLFSGCAAYGLDRLSLALYAQFGPRPADWPFQVLGSTP